MSDLARELFDRYRTLRQTSEKMSDIVLSLFEDSGSFATATKCCGYLEDMPIWRPTYKQRLRQAVEDNNQISRAWGVKARVEALIAENDPDPPAASSPNDDDIPF